MVCCQQCGFVFNQSFDHSLTSYGGDYDTSVPNSAVYRAHIDGIMEELLSSHHADTKRIVEVGCGQGSFLRELVRRGTKSTGVGFDPTYVGQDGEAGGRLRFERAFYGPASTREPADLVICRHVIEHVQDPIELLRLVRAALADSPRARVFFETPTIEWILHNQVLWDFFYEHCSLFTAETLRMTFQRAGFHVESVKHVFGGQYLWLEATVAQAYQPIETSREHVQSLIQIAEEYSIAERQIRQHWVDHLTALKKVGNLALWGGAAKGVTLANLTDPHAQLIDCIVDINTNKHGSFVPGTGHPVIGFNQMTEYDVKSVIITNPNYAEEIRATIAGVASDVATYVD